MQKLRSLASHQLSIGKTFPTARHERPIISFPLARATNLLLRKKLWSWVFPWHPIWKNIFSTERTYDHQLPTVLHQKKSSAFCAPTIMGTFLKVNKLISRNFSINSVQMINCQIFFIVRLHARIQQKWNKWSKNGALIGTGWTILSIYETALVKYFKH